MPVRLSFENIKYVEYEFSNARIFLSRFVEMLETGPFDIFFKIFSVIFG